MNLQNDTDMGLNSWIRILYLHGRNPALPDSTRNAILAVLTRYKYWVDEPTTPSDERKQVFWSENHQVMYATAEFLAGQLLPEEPFRDGRTGAAHRLSARARLARWLDDRLKYGFSEWYSTVYYEYDIMSLLNLVDFSEDETISKRAAMVLDLLIFDLARLTQGGSFGVTAGRAYGNNKTVGLLQSSGDTIEILFGTRGEWTYDDTPSAHALATTTRYCVPSVLLAIGRDRPERFIDRARASVDFGEPAGVGYSSDEDGMFWWSKGAYFAGPMVDKSNEMIKKWRLEHHFEEDLVWIKDVTVPLAGRGNDLFSVFFEGMALTRANLYAFRNGGAMLSSVQGFRPGQLGAQTNLWQATVDMNAMVFGTYPTTRDSDNGPNWWTGNTINPFVAQKESALVAVYAPNPVGAQALLFRHGTHLWFPFAAKAFGDEKAAEGFHRAGHSKFDEVRLERVHSSNDLDDSVWIFGKKATPVDEGYVGVYSAQPCSQTTTGTWAGKEILCEGLRNVLVVQVGSRSTFGSFDQFVEACRRARIEVGDGIRTPVNPLASVKVSFESPDPQMAASPGGNRIEVDYERREAKFGGQVVDLRSFPRFENPYGTAAWGATEYTIRHDDLSLRHDQSRDAREGEGLKPREVVYPFPRETATVRFVYAVNPAGDLLAYGHYGVVDPNAPRENDELAETGVRPNVEASPPPSPIVAPSEPVTSGAAVGRRKLPGMVVEQPPATSAAVATKPIDSAVVTQPQPRPAQITQHQLIRLGRPATGWQQYTKVLPGGAAPAANGNGTVLYGLTSTGELHWYRHDGFRDGKPSWQGPVRVGEGWSAFRKVVAGGEGVLYAIEPGGTLRWYKHGDAAAAMTPPMWSGPRVVGSGWQDFAHVFSGGEGVLYAVTSDGRMLWYRHRGYATGTSEWDGPREVGSGWAGLEEVFSPGEGLIYALRPGGELVWYRHEGYRDGSPTWQTRAGVTLATDWKDLRCVFARMDEPPEPGGGVR